MAVSEWPGGSEEGLRRHSLPLSTFRAICAGPVTPDIIRLIRMTQYSRRKLQLHALVSLATDDPTIVGPLTGVDGVWKLLSSIDSRAPDIVEDVLMYPTVGAWLSRIVHRIAAGESATTPLWTELGYLHSMTAAAAIRADVPVSIHVPVLYGAVNLPTVGQIRLPMAFPIGMAQILIAEECGYWPLEPRWHCRSSWTNRPRTTCPP
jgi:HEXXH motif-containing protein